MVDSGWSIIHEPFAISHQPSAMADRDLHTADAETVAVGDQGLVHPSAVDEGPVRALQVHDLQPVGAGGNPAVQSRDESGIDDEVGARRAADGFDRAGTQTERRQGFGTLQDPHVATFYPPISSQLFMAARK